MLVLAVLFGIVRPVECNAQEEPTSELHAKKRQDEATEINDLMKGLSSRKYAQRERSTRRLMAIGLPVLEQVRAAKSDRDAEVRLRCQRIERAIVLQDREHRVAGFLSGVRSDRPLPGWQRFRNRLGDSDQARDLMATVLREAWDAVEEFESAANDETTVAVSHVEKLRHYRRTLRLPITQSQMLTAMLMASDEKVSLPNKSLSELLSLLHQYSRTESGQDPWQDQQFRRLAGMVVQSSKTHPAATCYQGCSLSMRHGLYEGLVPAVAIIDSEEATPSMRQYAILTVARFGKDEHVGTLESQFSNTTTCYKRNVNNSAKTFECQVRDVALAAVIHLLSQDPRQFGFEQLRHNSLSVFQPHTLGFVDDEDRSKSTEKWQSYREQVSTQ